MRIGYFDCFSGAAGDMIIGSIISAGCEASTLQGYLSKLKIPGLKLHVEERKKHGLHGLGVSFSAEEKDTPHRHLTQIERMLSDSDLADEVIQRSIAIFRRIGVAESRMHNISLEKVHFHEVGAIDAIGDIVCAVSGLRELKIERLYSSPLLLGSGVTTAAHGKLPLPAPATLEITRGFPVKRIDSGHELTTPTGAAIISELAEPAGGFEFIVEKVGYGAGTAEFDDRPNMLRLIIGTVSEKLPSDSVIILETNIDDATPEQIGHLQQRLMESGALDVFVSSIMMKKNRPGHKVSVISAETEAKEIATVILRESSSAGVRWRRESRWKLDYSFKTVDTEFGKIKIKFYSGGDIYKFSPEYEDVVMAAAAAHVPFVRVYNAAVMAVNKLKELNE